MFYYFCNLDKIDKILSTGLFYLICKKSSRCKWKIYKFFRINWILFFAPKSVRLEMILWKTRRNLMPIKADCHLHAYFSGDSDAPMEEMIQKGRWKRRYLRAAACGGTAVCSRIVVFFSKHEQQKAPAL